MSQQSIILGPQSRLHVSAHRHTEEEIACLRAHAAHTEQLHEIMELAVDIATNRHGGIHALNVAFFHQNFSRLVTQVLDLRL